MEAEPNALIPQPLSLSIEKERQLDVTPEKPGKISRLRRKDEPNRGRDVEESEVVPNGVGAEKAVENRRTLEGKDVYARLSSPGVNSSARLYRKMEQLKTRRALQMEGGAAAPPPGNAPLIFNPDPGPKSRALQVQLHT